jgi:hypothetical protein
LINLLLVNDLIDDDNIFGLFDLFLRVDGIDKFLRDIFLRLECFVFRNYGMVVDFYFYFVFLILFIFVSIMVINF